MDSHHVSLIERDRSIKGLRYLLQPDLLARALAGQVETCLMSDLRTTYLRYKPGMNCIARFEFNGVLAYAKAFGGNLAVKFDKARQRNEVPGPGGPGRIFLDEAGILFSFFPNDAKLRSLVRLEDPQARQRFLKRIFKSDPSWINAKYTSLNYKPERRFVAKFTHRNGQAAVVKFFTRKGFLAMRHARKTLNLPTGLRMPDLIGGSKSHCAMAFSWLPGETLDPRLEIEHMDAFVHAGGAIGRFHMSNQPALETREVTDYKITLAAHADQLGHLIPQLAKKAKEIARTLHQRLITVAPVRRPVHGDFYDEQVIVHNGQVGLIDTDNAHLGDPVDDLGRFIANLERRKIEGMLNTAQFNQAKSGFLRGYRLAAPGINLTELNTFRALNLFQLTHQPFRHQRPEWPEQSTGLLDRCELLLRRKPDAD